VLAAIFASLAAGSAFIATTAGPWASAQLPPFMQTSQHSWFPLGPIFLAAGVAHFTQKQGFVDMYPHRRVGAGLRSLGCAALLPHSTPHPGWVG
jgi:hypothetical protein